jgi:site-specific recombinase XerD
MKMRPATGIRWLPSGWQAYLKIRGHFHSKVFPHRTALSVMKRWRENERIQARTAAPTLPLAGATLADDVKTYSQQRQTMPTLRHRNDDLQLWVEHFGRARVRRSITAGEIRAQLETWRAQGYAASTVNHRRTALMSLWTVLDGQSAPNPARDVPRFSEAQGPPRALSQAAVLALIDAMPSSQTRARLELLRWTGWPPAQIAKLTPEDVRWDDAVYVRPRRKGKGVAGAWLPLLPEGWAALREFKRLGCWGEFSTSSARTSFRRAARNARRTIATAYARKTLPKATARAIRRELLDVTPYQLRHSFATLVAGITQDDRAVQTLLQHSDIRTTHRYTSATADPRAIAGLLKVSAALIIKGETP